MNTKNDINSSRGAYKMANRAIDRVIQDWRSKIAGLTLQGWAEKLCSETGEEAFEVDNPGTIMKLLFLWNYMRFPYLHIMASQRRKQKVKNRLSRLFYFDPYAGNGIIRVKTDEEIIMIPGSAVLALLAPISLHEKRRPAYSYYWDVMVLNDVKTRYKELLVKRCKYITEQAPILEHPYTITTTLSYTSPDRRHIIITDYDCAQESNWLIFRQFFGEMKRKSEWIHGLVFLDPPSPREMPLRFLSKLLSIPSDVITLLHTGIFAENVNMGRYKPDTLADILDCDIKEAESLLGKTHTIKELEDLYLRKFCTLLGSTKIDMSSGPAVRDVIKSIPLRTGKGRYHLIVATRTTRGREVESWQRWFKNFADEVHKLSDVDSLVVDILTSKQAMLKS
jgi:hypothetical protein